MSGIAGLVRLDGAAATEPDARKMAHRMPHRGLDGIATWADGPAALAHLQRFVTPESLRERQPTAHTSGVVAVADLRLDDREGLLRQLGLRPGLLDGTAGPTDVDLLLAAYERWGTRTPEHLEGDFAFAIWSPTERTLFAACDPFGARTLYTHHSPGQLFAFGSEAKALLALPGIPDTIDEVRLAHFLTGQRVELDRTIFAAIQALPAAHAVLASTNGVRTWPYYTIAPASGLGALQGQEGVEAFRERFEASVRDRTRSAFPVGAQLSGGLDSSAIAVVARDALAARGGGPLHTYTLTFDATPSTDERPYAQAVLDQGGFLPHFVDADPLSPLGNLSEVYQYLDDTLVGGTQHQSWALLLSARDSGVRVVLDGLDGDSVVGHGDDMMSDAARAGDWAGYMRMARATAARYQAADHRQDFENQLSTLDGIFGRHGWPVLYEQARTGSRLRFLWSLERAVRHAGVVRSSALSKLGKLLLPPRALAKRRTPPPRLSVPPLVNRGWARSLGVALRPEVLGAAEGHQRLTLRERQQQLLAAPQILGSVRPGAHLAGALGFDLAHPFFDRRLVELCLALPPDLSFHDGWTRYVLRQSMSGRLPDAVAWRVGKAKMTPAVERAVREFDEPRLRAVAQDPGWLADVLDMDAFRQFAAPDRPLTELEMTHLAWISTAVVWLNRQWPCGPASPSIYHHSSG